MVDTALYIMGDNRQDILTRLGAGEVILGDGSYSITLERRGYVKVQGVQQNNFLGVNR